VTDAVSAPAVPAETFRFVLYVPGDIPSLFAESERVLLEPAAIVPDVAPRLSQPEDSLAVHDRDVVVLFFSVTEVLVDAVPKSTWSGVTSNFSGA
jgi:hypothetical protein